MFESKVAIVTGSARGIGKATAELLAKGGGRVVINDLDESLAAATAAEIGDQAISFGGNLTHEGLPEALVEAAIEKWGRLDIVVNNAGYSADQPIHKMSEAAFREMLDIHTVVPFKVLKAAAPYFREPAKKEREEGVEVFRKVVNISSLSAYGNASQTNYAAGKSGVIGFSKALAREWGPLKVNVNVVAFGFVDTRLTQAYGEQSEIEVEGRKVKVGMPQAVRDGLADLIPLGRAATPQEAAAGIAFLCSPWSDYVTGQVLNVSGGMPLGMSS